MTHMTARGEIIKVIQSCHFPWLRVDDMRPGRVLDVIPSDLLVHLLVERGVLEPVTLPHGNHTISVYQRKDQ